MCPTIKHYRKLLRVEQWYKNLLIFLPFLFVEEAMRYDWGSWVLGFFGFCAISSITYMINDWVDREEDRLHPTKKDRPLASGKVSGKQAVVIGILLGAFVGIAGWQLGSFYSIIVGMYFIITNAYSFGLKHIPLLDILIISGNFTLRTLAGVPELPDQTSLPYFLIVFSLLLILLTHKRRSDIKILGEKAAKHKPVLAFYTPIKCYLIRVLGYIGVGFVAIELWKGGLPLLNIAPPIGLLILTSIIFSRDPKLVIKPHYLFKLWYWDIALILTIILGFL